MHALRQLNVMDNTRQGLFKVLILVTTPPQQAAGVVTCVGANQAAGMSKQAGGQNHQQMAADPQPREDEPTASLQQGHCSKITLPAR